MVEEHWKHNYQYSKQKRFKFFPTIKNAGAEMIGVLPSGTDKLATRGEQLLHQAAKGPTDRASGFFLPFTGSRDTEEGPQFRKGY